MLGILCAWLVIVYVFYSMGYIAKRLFEKLCKQEEKESQFLEVFFLGLCVTGTLLTLSSLWFPVSTTTFVILFGFCLSHRALNSKFRKQSFLQLYTAIEDLVKKNRLDGILILLCILCFSLFPPLSYDSSLYHLQAILWNEEYGVVPGLANLHSRFGFNSNYLVLCAAFSMKSIFGQPIFAIHSLCLVLFLFWIKNLVRDTKSVQIKIGLSVFSFLFVFFYFRDISSPSTDLLPNLLVAYLLIRSVLDIQSIRNSFPAIWIITLFCITLKLATAPIAILLLLILFHLLKEKNYKLLGVLLGTSILILAPWFARNAILSGYLVFPFSAVDIFHFDWKVPLPTVIETQKAVYAWGRVQETAGNDVLSMSMLQWIPLWFAKLKVYNQILCGFCLLSFLSIFRSFINRKKGGENFIPFIIWLIAFAGVVFWFLSAPDFRFGYGFILSMIFIPFLLRDKAYPSLTKLSLRLFPALYALLLVFGVAFTVYKMHDAPLLSLLYKPTSIEYLEEKEGVKFTSVPLNSEIRMFYPSDPTCDRCYNHPIPCAPNSNNAPELRGNSLKDGFRVKNNLYNN